MWKNLKQFWSQYVDKNWAFIIFLLVLGTILSILSWAFGEPDSRPIRAIIASGAGSLGHTILAAGFFAAFLKTFQFIGVFKDAIKTLITKDDDFKNQVHDLVFTRETLKYASLDAKRKMWRNLTFTLYDGEMPEDADALLAEKILSSYLPNSIDFIQMDFVAKYDISYKDGDVIYKESSTYDIIPLMDTIVFKSSYFVWKKEDSADNSSITIKTFKINDTDFASEFKLKNSKDKGYDVTEKELSISLNEKLGNSFQKNKPITVKSVIEVKNTPLISPHFRYQFSKFTKGFEIDYKNNNPDEIIVKLELIDDRIDLREILEESTGLKNKNELLLPTDGYLLIVTPKNWKK
jgi:hypothetical protein